MVTDAAAGDISSVEKEIDSLVADEKQNKDVGLNVTKFYEELNNADRATNDSCNDRSVYYHRSTQTTRIAQNSGIDIQETKAEATSKTAPIS